MNAEADLAYLTLAVPDLQDYLLSQELFWPLPAMGGSIRERGVDQMTLGGVALALARLKCLDAAQADSFARQVEQVRARWRSNWSRKAAREFSSRVGVWGRALDDLLGERSGRQAAYPAQARLRVMLELLRQEMAPDAPKELGELAALDARLKAAGKPGEFIWEPSLAACFAQETFWFLYIHL